MVEALTTGLKVSPKPTPGIYAYHLATK